MNASSVAPFLSCVAETDSDQKSAVRRESVRVMGTLARSYGRLLVPHCGKVMSLIVKRLKDTDSAVRDACVETCRVLATSMAGPGGGEGGTVFVALAKPLFEALGEQNRYVQVGAALCLARVIDEAPQMLARAIKLLKNQHFMAKSAIIELIRSIIQVVLQVGFALAIQTLSAAVNSILEVLKSNDWATRKTASLVLAAIAVNPGASLISEVEILKDSEFSIQRNPIVNSQTNNSRINLGTLKGQGRDRKDATSSINTLEGVSGIWRRANNFLVVGNVESAHVEAVLSNDDVTLLQLMDRTGPILERLSLETTNDVLSFMAANFVDQRFLECTIPWLQQVVELSKTNESRQLFLSTKAQTDFLFALQEAAARAITVPVLRMSISPYAAKLHQLWLETPCRKNLQSRGSQGSKGCAF
ncbi:uncharacterized protein LOC141846503 [Curcuma longa]|uniref:uncharacterized protein LOC141846503 n=1 Tax=Curcuma longa TaxID=136217 RepID=UPI003D9F178A